MNRTIEDIQKDIELLGIKGGYDIEQLLTPQDCRRLSYEIERLNNILDGYEKEMDNLIDARDKAIEYIEDNSDDMHTYISQAITQILKGVDKKW